MGRRSKKVVGGLPASPDVPDDVDAPRAKVSLGVSSRVGVLLKHFFCDTHIGDRIPAQAAAKKTSSVQH